MLVNRAIFDTVSFLKDKYPILSISGPRQSGKTTFLKELFPGYSYITMEDVDNRNLLINDPKLFFDKNNCYVIIDEAQRSPELFSHLQIIADDKKIMGQFILTGSQNFLLLKSITQSLAGRVALFDLFPFDFNEMKSANLLSNNYLNYILKGFYPAIYDRDIPYSLFYRNYLKTFVERDIAEILSIRDIRNFRKFVALLANRAGQILNLNSVAKECGITQPTANSWLSVLEASYVVFLLPTYHNNYNKRILKSPKLYFYDTGLLSNIMKVKSEDDMISSNIKGALFENFVISEMVKQAAHKCLQNDFFYWRDSNGNEVDLIMESPDGLEIIEIKATKSISMNLTKGLNYFYNLANDSAIKRKVVYAGDTNDKMYNTEFVAWRNIDL